MKGNAQWDLNEELIHSKSDSGYAYLITAGSYSDFELQLEFMPDSTINSGVFVRCLNDTINAVNCHEINIWDQHPNQNFRTGSIVTKCTAYEKIETIDKWNKFRILCFGDSVLVWLNDIKTAEYRDTTLDQGPIALQSAGNGRISFRNMQILEK